ncbi:MAG: entericidin A/B family lipoprotein [Pseudomonadota bacterium]
MTHSLRLLAVLLLAGALTGCNTIRGAGEDVEAGGEAVSETAEEAEDEL